MSADPLGLASIGELAARLLTGLGVSNIQAFFLGMMVAYTPVAFEVGPRGPQTKTSV